MLDQLVLGIRLKDEVNFDNFYVGDNSELIASLRGSLQQSHWAYLYLWGAVGVGKSHLLQACCQYVAQHKQLGFYLPLKNLASLSPAILEDIAAYDLVVVDDVDQIVGHKMWEESLFHLFNHCMQSETRLVISGSCSPKQLSLSLPDLQSRITQGLSYHMKPLSDDQKLEALQLRAKRRGMVLPDEVGRYLLTHYPRRMHDLFDFLEVLDQGSIKLQHRLTIPFVKWLMSKNDTRL
jgi:DnaA-homolog protein